MVFIVKSSPRQPRSLVTSLVFLFSSGQVSPLLARMFKGQKDVYNGITVDSTEEHCTTESFREKLNASMEQWRKERRRTIWFRVHLQHTSWVPELAQCGFKFHHAKEECITMYKWISTQEECNIPPYAHTNLGAGAFVYNEETEELLVIKEKYTAKRPLWKLPGGYVEPGENIEAAAKREVLEETGVQAEFKCLLAFRHGHGYSFGCSDIYTVSYLAPITFDIRKCNREILECRWMKLKEYAEHSEVHENNRAFAKKFIEFLDHRMGVCVEYARHPLTKKPICVYSVAKVDSKKQ